MDKNEALEEVRKTGTVCFEGGTFTPPRVGRAKLCMKIASCFRAAAIYGATLVISLIALSYDKYCKSGGGYDEMDDKDGNEMRSMVGQNRTI